ncbi:MAG: bifunctional biotin--[acetyl-CoA-carboxylase] ligase/biotin operon repressor BirA [Aeromonas sp.]
MRLTPTREHFIDLVADGQFHSGEEIGAALGITRAAVSKHARTLRSFGLDLFSVSGKGYRLAMPLARYAAERLQQAAPLAPIHCFAVQDSTNQYLLERTADLVNGESCVAECQTAGRGRRGRPWISPFGCQLLLSMYWRLNVPPQQLGGLSIALAVAAVEALAELGYRGVMLKWPNDIYYQGRKLAGILIETSGVSVRGCHAVMGIGLNVTIPSVEGAKIDQTWSDLQDIVAGALDRNLLAAAMLRHWQQALTQFEQAGLEPFLSRWMRYDQFANRPVRLLRENDAVEGTARGLDADGALLVETPQGLLSISMGEVSLRGA